MNLTNLVDAMGLVFQQQLQCDILLVKYLNGVAYLIVTEVGTGKRFQMTLQEGAIGPVSFETIPWEAGLVE
jgi:hypothetical protein